MTQTPSSDRSDCHNAPVTIGGRGDFDDKDKVVTQYHVCSECSKPCGLAQTPSPSKGLLKLRKELDKLDKPPSSADLLDKLIQHWIVEDFIELPDPDSRAVWESDITAFKKAILSHIKQVEVEARIECMEYAKNYVRSTLTRQALA